MTNKKIAEENVIHISKRILNKFGDINNLQEYYNELFNNIELYNLNNHTAIKPIISLINYFLVTLKESHSDIELLNVAIDNYALTKELEYVKKNVET